MKKILKLSIIAFLVSIVIPLNAKALKATIFASNSSMTETTEGGNTFSINSEESTLYIGANVTEGSFTELNAHVELESSNFSFSGNRSDYKLTSGWSGTVTKSASGNGIDIKVTNSSGISDTRKLILSIDLDVKEGTLATENCLITLSTVSTPTATPENPKCKVVDNVYYDANGNVVSKEAYDAACSPAENPQTGSFLPYTIIIALIVLAGWLYYVTKKNNKIYEI